MSVAGRWAPWYERHVTEREPYARTVTYDMAADWLAGLAVEDWGCGYGYFQTVHDGPYLGVDGTPTPFTDVVDDLTTRRSRTEGVLLRHVLEHNPEPDWRFVLANALQAATRRAVIVVFTPDAGRLTRAKEIGRTAELDVPDMALPYRTIDAALYGWDITKVRSRSWWDDPVWRGACDPPWRWQRTTIATEAAYGIETVWRAERVDA